MRFQRRASVSCPSIGGSVDLLCAGQEFSAQEFLATQLPIRRLKCEPRKCTGPCTPQKGPNESIEQFCKMETEGGRLTHRGGYKPGVSLSVPARSFPKLPLPWAVREFSGGTARRNELSESTTRNTHSFLLWHSFVIATLAVAFLWFLPKFEVKRPRQRPFD